MKRKLKEVRKIRELAKSEHQRTEIIKLRYRLIQETYTGPKGELRWISNESVVPLSAFGEAGLEPPKAQNAARKAQTASLLAEYRDKFSEVTEKQKMEARAAFGPGKTMVNIITGQKYRT